MIVLSGKKFKYTAAAVASIIAAIVVLCTSIFIIRQIYPIKYGEYVFEYSERYGVDPYLVLAIMKAESGFDSSAESKKGAKGLMQVTDITGKWVMQILGEKDFEPQDLYDPGTNIRIGTWYISWLNKEFENNPELVISAYNCGHGRLKEWLTDSSISKSGKSLDRIPFPETEGFTRKVLRYYKMYKRLYGESKVVKGDGSS